MVTLTLPDSMQQCSVTTEYEIMLCTWYIAACVPWSADGAEKVPRKKQGPFFYNLDKSILHLARKPVRMINMSHFRTTCSITTCLHKTPGILTRIKFRICSRVLCGREYGMAFVKCLHHDFIADVDSNADLHIFEFDSFEVPMLFVGP